MCISVILRLRQDLGLVVPRRVCVSRAGAQFLCGILRVYRMCFFCDNERGRRGEADHLYLSLSISHTKGTGYTNTIRCVVGEGKPTRCVRHYQ